MTRKGLPKQELNKKSALHLGRYGNYKCKGPEVEMNLAFWGGKKEAGVIRA